MPEEAPDSKGDLAIVLHSHMPYVEGFGTYPFGEEWLFDAVVRSYLPILEFAEHLTMTVTPVLADQLEDRGLQERLREFLQTYRIGSAAADAADADEEYVPAALAEQARWERALAGFDRLGGDLVKGFREASDEGRIALVSSAATHAVLPLLATRAGASLQIDAGLRSHERRFGRTGGFWLPECAFEPGVEDELAEHDLEWFFVDQSAHQADPLDALRPVSTAAGPVALPIDWEAVSWLWALDGYPSDPAYAQFAGKSWRGTRIWSISNGPYDPEAAVAAAKRDATRFVESIAERLERYSAERGRRGLITYAIDTELLGHWWSEGPVWLEEVLHLSHEAGVRMLTVPEALAEHEAEARELHASTWGERKDLSTWDSNEVADLTWGARRCELRLLRALGDGVTGDAAMRATRELLAVQSSDWAFLDSRGQAGDYAYLRAINHAEAMLEAIEAEEPCEPRMRTLAPDLSLSPLREP